MTQPAERTPADLVEAVYSFLRGRPVAPVEELLDADFVGVTTAGLPAGLGGVHEGRDAMVRDVWGAIARLYRVVPEVEEVVVAGERVVVRGTYVGSGRASGSPLRAAFVHLWTVRGGRFVALEQITDSAAWRDALG